MTANATHEMVINLVPSIAEMPASAPLSLISDTPFFETAVAIALARARARTASVAMTTLARMAPRPMPSRRRVRVRTAMHDRNDSPEKAAPRTYRTKVASRKLLT